MFYHEYDIPGSAFPRNETVLVERDDGKSNQSTAVGNREISKYKHAATSIYMGKLFFFSGSFDHSVVTSGGAN